MLSWNVHFDPLTKYSYSDYFVAVTIPKMDGLNTLEALAQVASPGCKTHISLLLFITRVLNEKSANTYH